MLGSVLESKRVRTFCAAFAAAAAVAVVGCVTQLRLSDLSRIAHTESKPLVPMGKMMDRGMSCIDCHDDAMTGDRPGTRDRDFCVDCHEELKGMERFVLGGPLYKEDGSPKWSHNLSLHAGTSFSHAKHASRSECAECHGDIHLDDYSLTTLADRYENCARCHSAQIAEGTCGFCHQSLDKKSLPHSHDSRWLRAHGTHVRDEGGMDAATQRCGACHPTSYCTECHQTQPPRDHTVFWNRAAHGFAASIDRERCAACHTQDLCLGCHRELERPRPPGHPQERCLLCHTGLERHVVFTDNCLLCHN